MTRTIRRVPLANFADGTELALQIHEIRGTLGDGPTLGLSAAIHGNEQTGVHCIKAIAERHGDGQFRGRLLLLPVANPLAFQANKRFTPVDGQNLNRVFPGRTNGMFTEQLAVKIRVEFLEHLDAYLDFHTGTDRPTVDYIYVHNALELSRAFGSPLLFRPEAERQGPVFNGTSKAVTVARGVPSVTIELGGGLIDQRPYIERGIAGIENVMHKLGMLDGPARPLPAQTVVGEMATIYPSQGGLIYADCPPLGQEIAGGAVLGRIVSPYTFEELEVIRSPFEKGIMVLSHLTANLVEPGDYGFMVGNLAGAEHFPATT